MLNSKKVSNKSISSYFQDDVCIASWGLTLGMFGTFSFLDLCLKTLIHNFYPVFVLMALVFFLFSLLFTFFKFKDDHFSLKRILQDKFLVSLLPTCFMSIMCFAGFIAQYSLVFLINSLCTYIFQIIAALIMVIALILQFFLIPYFFYLILFKHHWKNQYTYSTWFIPSVGIATACNFSHDFYYYVLPNIFFQVIWYIAFIFLVLLLPIMILAVLFWNKETPKSKIPHWIVFIAPIGLTFTGYNNTFLYFRIFNIKTLTNLISHYSNYFIYGFTYFLFTFFLIFFVVMFVLLIKILQQKFSYMFAAITFSLAINSAGFYYCAYLMHLHALNISNSSLNYVWLIIYYIGVCIYFLAVIINSYIAIRFIILFKKDFKLIKKTMLF